MKQKLYKLLRIFIFLSLLASYDIYGQEVKKDTIKIREIQEIALNWSSTYKEALKKSKKQKKPVLIYFTGSDWCGPCKILDRELFHTERFKKLSDNNLILLEVDIPRRRDLIEPDKMSENLYLQKKYRVKSFPTFLMVNHRGRKIAEKSGYVITEYYYPFFQKVINKY
jgi:thioredoxin-related protein